MVKHNMSERGQPSLARRAPLPAAHASTEPAWRSPGKASDARRAQALHQALHLDVEGLVAQSWSNRLVGRDKRNCATSRSSPTSPSRRLELEADPPERAWSGVRLSVAASLKVPVREAQPQPPGHRYRRRHLRCLPEALGLRAVSSQARICRPVRPRPDRSSISAWRRNRWWRKAGMTIARRRAVCGSRPFQR